MFIEVGMIYTPDAYNTKDWTNVILKKPLFSEQWQWLQAHKGGMYHIHRSNTAIKFENKEDAALFALKWC